MKILFAWIAGLMCIGMSAQGTLSGRVLDSKTGKGIPSAYVELMGSGQNTLTDASGRFEFLKLPNGNYTLKFTAMGYGDYAKAVYLDGTFEVEAKLNSSVTVLESQVESLSISAKTIDINAATVTAQAADAKTPVTYWNVSKKEIEKLNNGQDLPQLLRFTPSLVTTSDAGNGVGYTGLRIRGSDASRINVTINGIPLNDAESQGVFWVNTPDLASSADAIQIQRGVGTSTNGAGAFGGTVKILTAGIDNEPGVTVSNAYGSFNTWKHSLQASTGRINNWGFEMRLSQITSNGYIDRATSDLKSYYAAGGYDNGRTKVTGVVFGGNERTYQSWWGTPESRLQGSEEDMLIHAANNGLSESQTANLLNSGRTYNYYEYENQVDDYSQDHYQLHFDHRFGSNLKLNLAGHYTYGRGFFEEYREEDAFSSYGLNPIFIDGDQVWSDGTNADGDPVSNAFAELYGWDEIEISQSIVTDADGNPITDASGNTLLDATAEITRSDIIRRRWLENDFYGAVGRLDYRLNNWNFTLGGGWNQYDGDHFGELTWMEHSNGTSKDDIYYLSTGLKTDMNAYLKTSGRLSENLTLYVDLQVRNVGYEVDGTDNDLRDLQVDDELSFFNPKAGLTWFLNRNDKLYGSYAVANREPTRQDYVDALFGAFPKPERMSDIEVGYQRNMEKYYVGINFFSMDYTDQLVLTGQLNDVGTPIRMNVDESYRRGVELELSWNIRPRWNLWATGTLSQNKIVEHVESVYDYTFGFDIVDSLHTNADIALSPNATAAAVLSFLPVRNRRHDVEIAWMAKYVGDQFLDNTNNEAKMIDAYFINDMRVTWRLKQTLFKELNVNFLVNNILDVAYVSNGYTFSYIAGEAITENFYYPQALRNYSLGLTVKF